MLDTYGLFHRYGWRNDDSVAIAKLTSSQFAAICRVPKDAVRRLRKKPVPDATWKSWKRGVDRLGAFADSHLDSLED